MTVDLRCASCGQVHAPWARIVTLHDGRQVSNYSEEWRAECEARDVIDLPTLTQRRQYVELVERKRGAESARKLRALIRTLWGNRGKKTV
jgi:hypothetical protein